MKPIKKLTDAPLNADDLKATKAFVKACEKLYRSGHLVDALVNVLVSNPHIGKIAITEALGQLVPASPTPFEDLENLYAVIQNHLVEIHLTTAGETPDTEPQIEISVPSTSLH